LRQRGAAHSWRKAAPKVCIAAPPRRAKYDQTTHQPETDLSQGVFQSLVDVTSIENVIGTAYNDQIYEDATAHRITGGGGADLLVGGGGSDTFVYNAVADSTGANYDTINYLDATSDKFDFNFAVTGVDASVRGGSLSTASFDGDLASAIGSGQLNASHAVLFDPTTGDLAGHTFLIVDSDCRCQ